MSAAKKEENNPLFDQNHSEETRTKMSEAHKGKTHSEEKKNLRYQLNY
jgi:hypothetical protein